MKFLLKISFLLFLIGGYLPAQRELTSHAELWKQLKLAADKNKLINVDTLTFSTEGRAIPMLMISSDSLEGEDKINLLVFAQQHGNEQSGKEAALLLVREVAAGELDSLFTRISLILIPQMNPDGSEKDERRNGEGADLNRDHLILSQPETAALHKLFHKIRPEVTLDVHEYNPFSKSWMNNGYIKKYDEQFGAVTNPNVSAEIKKFSKEKVIPFVDSSLTSKGFSFHEYLLGGPPGKERMRFSTADINDGRNSFGIFNTLSFILEGRNGFNAEDSLTHRSQAQLAAIKSLLNFVYANTKNISKLIEEARQNLNVDTKVKSAIRIEHIKGDEPVKAIEVLSLKTGKDTVVTISEFHDSVETRLYVRKPAAYLVEKNDTNIKSFLNKHNVQYESYQPEIGDKILQYNIIAEDKSVDEELENYYLKVEGNRYELDNPEYYYMVSLDQPASELIVTAFEPQSMFGLIQYDEFKYLISNPYAILRLEK